MLVINLFWVNAIDLFSMDYFSKRGAIDNWVPLLHHSYRAIQTYVT